MKGTVSVERSKHATAPPRFTERKNIQLEAGMYSEIARLSRRFGVPEAEVMRRAISLGLDGVEGTFSPGA